MNYYRRFPGDYARDTKHLSLLEHGAYTLLLDALYANEKPLPKDRVLLYRICVSSTKREKKAVEYVLSNFFVEKPAGFSNKKFEKEITHSESRVNAAKENGRRGGRPRSQKPTGVASNNPEHNPQESSPAPAPEPTNTNTTSKEATAAPAALGGIPLPIWLAFVEMRRKKRQPLTDAGAELIREKLEWLEFEGFDKVKVLEQSIMNSWSGVFALKGSGDGKPPQESFDERKRRRSDEAISEVLGGAGDLVQKMDKRLPDARGDAKANPGVHRGPRRFSARAN